MRTRRPRSQVSYGRFAALFRADAYDVLNWRDRDLTVAKFSSVCRSQNRINHEIFDVFGNDYFDLDFRDKFDLILSAPIRLGMSLLATVALYFADGHPVHVDFLEGGPNGIQQVWPDNRFD